MRLVRRWGRGLGLSCGPPTAPPSSCPPSLPPGGTFAPRMAAFGGGPLCCTTCRPTLLRLLPPPLATQAGREGMMTRGPDTQVGVCALDSIAPKAGHWNDPFPASWLCIFGFAGARNL